MAEKDDTNVMKSMTASDNAGNAGVSLQLIRTKKKKKKKSTTSWVVEQEPSNHQNTTTTEQQQKPLLVIPLPKKQTHIDGPLLVRGLKPPAPPIVQEDEDDKEAIKALIQDADPTNQNKKNHHLIIDSNKKSNPSTPNNSSTITVGAKDMNVESDYTNVSISDFGAAMLRGMGWTGSTTSSSKKEKDDDIKSRPARLGLGATPLIMTSTTKNTKKKKKNHTMHRMIMTNHPTKNSAVYKTLVEEHKSSSTNEFVTKEEIQTQIQQQIMENQKKLQKYSFITTSNDENSFAIVMETQGIPGLNQIAIQPLHHHDNNNNTIINTSRSNVTLVPYTKLTPSQHSFIQSIHLDPSFFQQSSYEKEEETTDNKNVPHNDKQVKPQQPQQQQQNYSDKYSHERTSHAVTKRNLQRHDEDIIHHRKNDDNSSSSSSTEEERYRKRRKKHKKERRKYYSDDSKDDDDDRRHGRKHSRRRRREYDYSDESDESRRRQTRKKDKKRRKERRHSKHDDESTKMKKNNTHCNWRLIPFMGVKMIELKQYAKVLNVVRRSSSSDQLYATCQLLNSTKTTIKKVLQEELQPMIPTSIGQVVISIINDDTTTTTIGTIIEVSNQSAIVQCSDGIIQPFPTSALATYYGPIHDYE